MENILLYLSAIKLSILTTANVSKTSHKQVPLNPSNSVDYAKIFRLKFNGTNFTYNSKRRMNSDYNKESNRECSA